MKTKYPLKKWEDLVANAKLLYETKDGIKIYQRRKQRSKQWDWIYPILTLAE